MESGEARRTQSKQTMEACKARRTPGMDNESWGGREDTMQTMEDEAIRRTYSAHTMEAGEA